MSLSIVTVVHDSGPQLGRMLESLELLGDPAPEVICVDSGSTDDGPALALERGARLISLEGNPGYGAACNAGVATAGSDVCVLLNPDTVLVDDGLRRLADLANRTVAHRVLVEGGQLRWR